MQSSSNYRQGWCTLLAALALSSVAAAQSNCLIISEIVDGPLPGGLPKFVELTNTGTLTIDLSEYSLGNINNGDAQSDFAPVTLTGLLQPGDSYVCSYEYGDYPGNSVFYDVYGFDPDNFAFGSWINGNDVVVLYYGNPGAPHNGTGAIDIYGVVGVDGSGEAWEYTDGYAYREDDVFTSGPWAPSEWTFGGPLSLESEDDLLAYTTPGAHDFPFDQCGPDASLTGRCCVPPYYCYITTQTGCGVLGGTFTLGEDCDGDPCGTPPPTGACCVGEDCFEVSFVECGDLGGNTGAWVAGTYCTPNPCLSCVNIPDARVLPLGTEVLLCDVVVNNVIDTVGSADVASFQVQEESTDPNEAGGITVFGGVDDIDPILMDIFEGDVIRISGTLDEFNGLLELTAPFTWEVITYGTGERPDAVVVTASDFALGSELGEVYESMFVEVQCAHFREGGFFAPLTNYLVDDNTGTFTARVPTADLDLLNQPIPTDPINLRGIFSDYGGYQLLLTRYADIFEDPLCLTTGACCLPPTFEECDVTTEAECLAADGQYQGGGTRCNPFNPCLEPVGACCYEIEGVSYCTQEFANVCVDTLGGGYQGDYTLCGAFTCAPRVRGGDVAHGLSDDDRTVTTRLIRDGAMIGAWTQFPYVQSFEFDNYDGLPHNARGNLLALNYGSPLTSDDPGGKLHSFATDGTSDGQYALYEWNGDQGSQYLTRITGLGISWDNAFLAVWGWDTKYLYILGYDEGPQPGSGAGAAITEDWVYTATAAAGGSQSCTWIPPLPENDPCYDDYTVLVAQHGAIPGQVKLVTYHFAPPSPDTGITKTERLSIFLPSSGQFTDVEFNPLISPYVYVLAGNFTGTSTTYLAIVDPHIVDGTCAAWEVVKVVNMSASSQTSRECAIGQDGYLYWSQFHSGTGTPFIDRVYALDPDAITDNSSEDWHSGDPYSSYNGMDVAWDVGVCYGDTNCDGVVDLKDINPFALLLANPAAWQTAFPGCNPLVGDINGDSVVDLKDINPFVALLASGGLPIPCE